MTRLEERWDKAKGYIEDALAYAHGTHTIEDVGEAISKGQLILWLGERCAGVTEFLHYPRKRVLNLFLVGGDIEEMKTLQPGVEAYARAHGCDGVQFCGRLPKGAGQAWARIWPDYVPTHTHFYKELP